MKRSNPDLHELLAAEYVLGTLQGGARRRFEQRVASDADLAASVDAWSLRLNRLATGVPPVNPPRSVWDAIEQRLRPTAKPGPHSVPRSKLTLWKGLTLVSSLAAALLATVLLLPGKSPGPPPQLEGYVAMIRDAQSRPVWVIDAAPNATRLHINNALPMDMPAGKRCYLWVRPHGQETPQLLGALPDTGEAVLEVPTGIRNLLPGRLMVSIENANAGTLTRPREVVDMSGQWMRSVGESI